MLLIVQFSFETGCKKKFRAKTIKTAREGAEFHVTKFTKPPADL